MAILKLKFDNLLCFNNFEADFSYPKKIVNSPLENEYLKIFPNFRYRKVNIIVGSNATGKSSLGKIILTTFIFLRDKEAKPLKDIINDNKRQASLLMDYVFADGLFFRFEAIVEPDGDIKARYRALFLNKKDTYESAVKRLENKDFDNYLKEMEPIKFGGWRFNFPTIETGFDRIRCIYNENESKEFVNTYRKILKVLDPSIDDVFKSKEQENTFIIKFDDGKTVSVKDGETISGLSLLSSGTKYAINIAGLFYAIKNHDNGFYYVDEQFSYVNSDIEIACLANMIEMLGDGEQLFFTTHNEEVLDMALPNHSFNFIKKEKNENNLFEINMINGSLEKRNNVNIKNLYENDYFGIAPDTSKIYEA